VASVGFLYYNLRYPGNRRARVFLGDNGSMLLGFLFAWLFIALSQGEPAAMTPVTALWLFALPLMDTVGVMLRRIWLGKSPFRADRHHLHHLFVRAGIGSVMSSRWPRSCSWSWV
jgi:UDP-GlcNAc:undecaprenyl-phosphate GlcNAc-1-phosphate transferase